MGVTDQGAREARYAEAVAAHADLDSAGLDGRRLALAVMAVADAEVSAAVSEAQAEARSLRSRLELAGRTLTAERAAAEAEVGRLREGITSLLPAECWVSRSERVRCIDFVGGTLGSGTFSLDMVCLPCRLRALLDPSPAATTDEDDEPLPDYLKELQRPALASSGEAATGEARDPMRCDGCGVPEADCPGLPADACCCKVCAHYPAPVVTPNAEGSE